MSNLPRIEIYTDGIIGRVEIDGEEVKGVRGYSITHNAGEIPVLKLELIATNLTIDGNILPELPDIFKPFYREISDDNKSVGDINA